MSKQYTDDTPPPRVQAGLELLHAIDVSDDVLAEEILSTPNSVDVNTRGYLDHGHYHPLLLAVIKNNIKIVNLILQHPDCDPNLASGGPYEDDIV